MKSTLPKNQNLAFEEYSWSSIKKTNQDFFDVDDMINAYQKGCDEGFIVSINKMRKDLKSRLNKILPVMQQFYNSINDNSSACKLMFLKLSEINRFDFIIALDKNLFYNDEFCRPVYENSFKLGDEYPNIGISFMPFCENINYESLKSDNFIAVYGKPE